MKTIAGPHRFADLSDFERLAHFNELGHETVHRKRTQRAVTLDSTFVIGVLLYHLRPVLSIVSHQLIVNVVSFFLHCGHILFRSIKRQLKEDMGSLNRTQCIGYAVHFN